MEPLETKVREFEKILVLEVLHKEDLGSRHLLYKLLELYREHFNLKK
jgi:hypothetical protein